MAENNLLFTETQQRCYEKLHHDLGDRIIMALEDKAVQEIMLNPDGGLWLDHAQQGQFQVGHLNPEKGYAIMNAVAGIRQRVVSFEHPCLEAELPWYRAMRGERFTGQVPPVVAAPCFTLRKKSATVFTLADYVATGRLTTTQAQVLSDLVGTRKNVLVCGGPGSGKTTVTNALIQEAVQQDANQRFVLLEDIPELQCTASNKLALVTSPTLTLTHLLRAAMRMRPDRILIGEVRGGEALDMLKAWNTGCPGGLCTVHANGAEEAVQRILDLALEAGIVAAPVGLLLQTIDAIVAVERRANQKGFIQGIVALGDYQDGQFTFKQLA